MERFVLPVNHPQLLEELRLLQLLVGDPSRIALDAKGGESRFAIVTCDLSDGLADDRVEHPAADKGQVALHLKVARRSDLLAKLAAEPSGRRLAFPLFRSSDLDIAHLHRAGIANAIASHLRKPAGLPSQRVQRRLKVGRLLPCAGQLRASSSQFGFTLVDSCGDLVALEVQRRSIVVKRYKISSHVLKFLVAAIDCHG